MDKILAVLLVVVIFLGALGGICLLLAFPFMWIWNYAVIAAVSVANPITYWNAFWLSIFMNAYVAGSSYKRSES